MALPTLPVTFQDELDSQNPNDVIGDPAYFEIDNLKLAGINGNTLQVDIRFNYGGGASLALFTINGFDAILRVDDLFLNTTAGTYAYILSGHDGLTTNSLYKVASTQTAASLLGNPAGGYQLISAGTTNVSTEGGVETQLLASIYLTLDVAGTQASTTAFRST